MIVSGCNYFYIVSSNFIEVESQFTLKMLPSRGVRRKGGLNCPLCSAPKLEFPLKKFNSGSLYFNKYPVVDRSYLYISKEHSRFLTYELLEEVRALLFSNPNYTLFSNMDGICSIPDHFHLECIPQQFLTKKILDFFKQDQVYFPSISNTYYVEYLAFDLEDLKQMNGFLALYNKLISNSYLFNLCLLDKKIFLYLLDDVFALSNQADCSARTFLGLFSTSSDMKYEFMKSLGLVNTLASSSIPISKSLPKFFL